jgi:hypothetical protein
MVATVHAVAEPPEDAEPPADAPEVGGIRLKRKAPAKKRHVILFWIDDRPYSVPEKPGAEFALQVLNVIEQRGTEVGVAYMLRRMLGDEGYAALMSYEDLDPDDLATIIRKAHALVNGALEGPKKGLSRG